jgi:hypothetical protein
MIYIAQPLHPVGTAMYTLLAAAAAAASVAAAELHTHIQPLVSHTDDSLYSTRVSSAYTRYCCAP